MFVSLSGSFLPLDGVSQFWALAVLPLYGREASFWRCCVWMTCCVELWKDCARARWLWLCAFLKYLKRGAEYGFSEESLALAGREGGGGLVVWAWFEGWWGWKGGRGK